jgi:hypothetical protein
VPGPVRPMPGEGAHRPRHRTGSPAAWDGTRRAVSGRQASDATGARYRRGDDGTRHDAGYRENGWREDPYRDGYREDLYRDGYREDLYRDGYRDNGRRHEGYRDNGWPDEGYRDSGWRQDGRGESYRDDGYRDNGDRDRGWREDRYRDAAYGAGGRGDLAGEGRPWHAGAVQDGLPPGLDEPYRPPGSGQRPPGGDRRARHGARPRRRRRRRLRDRRGMLPILAGLEVVVIAFVCVTGWSIGHALTMPGGGTFAERLAEWGRDHYLGPLITLGEYLTYTPPKAGGTPTAEPSFNAAAAARAAARSRARNSASLAEFAPPKRLKSPAGHPLPGEGVWRVLATVHGKPAMFGTWLRPDPVHTSYVEGIVEMNQQLLSFQLHPGVEDPGPGNWHSPAWIPPGHRRGLVATFNGGFKIASSDGGFYLNGTYDGPLVRGVASVVYYRDGHIAIGLWGSGGLRMSPDVVGVRQNLHLIIENGHIPATVDQNVLGAWGATLGGAYYEWRSGIGITRTGRVVFAYGPALDVRTLAGLLKRAGCVTAMQLDINPDWMSFMYYRPGHHPSDPTPFNLLQDQMQPPNRYYSLANRDFTAVYAR